MSGIILSSRLAQGQANIGESIVLDVIGAVVIGGTSLSGGRVQFGEHLLVEVF